MLSDEKSLLEQMTIEQARQNITLLKAEEIEMPKKWVLELLNTIEALQQENEQLQAQLDEWKYEVKCHMDEVIAREKQIEQLQAQAARMWEALRKAREAINGYSTCPYCWGVNGHAKGCKFYEALQNIDTLIGGKEDV